MKLIQAKVDNKSRLEEPYRDPFSEDQYRISSFVPERQRWSYNKVGKIVVDRLYYNCVIIQYSNPPP